MNKSDDYGLYEVRKTAYEHHKAALALVSQAVMALGLCATMKYPNHIADHLDIAESLLMAAVWGFERDYPTADPDKMIRQKYGV